MTYKEVLQELKKFKGEFCVHNDGRIRNRVEKRGYCPIARLNFDRGGRNSCMVNFLSNRLIETIMNAADGTHMTPRRRQVRKDLLRVLGLKEPA